MGTNVNPYPVAGLPIVEPSGTATPAFFNLLMQLWTRTGGAVGDTIGVQLTDGEVLPLDTLATEIVDLVIANPATLKKLTASVFPTGILVPWAPASKAPEGFLLCDGSAVSRTAYADLFAKIGVQYGNGDGVNTFTLPNTAQVLAWNSGLTLLPILAAMQWIIKT